MRTTSWVSDNLDGAHVLGLSVGSSTFGMSMGLVDAHLGSVTIVKMGKIKMRMSTLELSSKHETCSRGRLDERVRRYWRGPGRPVLWWLPLVEEGRSLAPVKFCWGLRNSPGHGPGPV